MDISIGNTFRVTIPCNSRPSKIYLDHISIAADGRRLFHYSYYNYYAQHWIHQLVDEADFMHLIATRPRRKRKRRDKKEDARIKRQARMRKG